MRNERSGNDYGAYLPPQEQLIIGAKVNRLCEATPDTFDPTLQVQDALDIVNALDKRVRQEGRFSLRATRSSKDKSQVRAGATNAGTVNSSFETVNTQEHTFGIHEYKIGGYVATKSAWREPKGRKELGKLKGHDIVSFGKVFSRLTFEYFWDRGEINQVFEAKEEFVAIQYDANF